jgi:hypothetical protein
MSAYLHREYGTYEIILGRGEDFIVQQFWSEETNE